MKILSSSQTRALDAYTIEHEPIDSIDLMERASRVFTDWFCEHYPDPDQPVAVFCGPGNNGGDGLAVARMLYRKAYEVSVYLVRISENLSPDAQQNLERLPARDAVSVHPIREGQDFPELPSEAIIIDAIFGSGLNRPVEGYWSELIAHLNILSNPKVAIDIPSGLFADQHSPGKAITAERTLSFEVPKLAFFFPENHLYVGEWATRSIGLSATFLADLSTPYQMITAAMAKSLLRPRKKYDHKGSNGHALIIAGGEGKFGAAILATRACLRSGSGLVTVHVPKQGYPILQNTTPEAMVSVDRNEKYFAHCPKLEKYQAIGAGPGIGKKLASVKALGRLLRQSRCPLVLDADALNVLGEAPDLQKHLPINTVLTPHPKEFSRLFGEAPHDFGRLALLQKMAQDHEIFIVLKMAHTIIATPEGSCYFNSSGNPGMATGGSGDVLTGILTGLLAQGYSPLEACLLGVYIHGRAGDLAAKKLSQEAMIAGDIIEHLGKAFLELQN